MLAILLLLSACGNEQQILEHSKFEVDKSLYPYQPHYLELEDGSKLHYIDEGKGPIILLLHGNPTWSFLYRHIIVALKDDFRLIAPDYPGFGLSTAAENYTYTPKEHADAINQLVQKLKLDDMAIMMQDWGGPIGFHVALQTPQRVSRFIVGNTWAWPLDSDGHKKFSSRVGGWLGQFGAWCCNGIVKFFMNKGVINQLSDKEMAMYLAPFKKRQYRKPTHIFAKQLMAAKPFLENINKQLSRISDRPMLLVWGMKDFAFKAPQRHRFESIFKSHTTVLLPNAGHFIQEDAPNDIALAIRGFYGK